MQNNNMHDRYSLLIDAVCYWLGFQVKIGREKLIHEASLRYPIADAITSENTIIKQIKLEESHPLFKSKRIDLVIYENTKEKILQEIYEFKIAKYTTNESDEHQRVFDDVIRLAYLNMVENKDCYFLMCGGYDNFKQDFVGDKITPSVKDGKIFIPTKNNAIRGWISGGLYKDWFEFIKGKKKEITFSISDSKNNKEWGLSSFKDRYELRNEITSKEFYNSKTITIITECMAITPYGADRTHAAGIWKIEAKK